MKTKILKPIEYRDLRIGQQVQVVTTAANVKVTVMGRVQSTGNYKSILIGDATTYHEVTTQPFGAEVTFSVVHELPEKEGSLVLVLIDGEEQPVRLWAGRWRLLNGDEIDINDVIAGYIRTLWDAAS